MVQMPLSSPFSYSDDELSVQDSVGPVYSTASFASRNFAIPRPRLLGNRSGFPSPIDLRLAERPLSPTWSDDSYRPSASESRLGESSHRHDAVSESPSRLGFATLTPRRFNSRPSYRSSSIAWTDEDYRSPTIWTDNDYQPSTPAIQFGEGSNRDTASLNLPRKRKPDDVAFPIGLLTPPITPLKKKRVRVNPGDPPPYLSRPKAVTIPRNDTNPHRLHSRNRLGSALSSRHASVSFNEHTNSGLHSRSLSESVLSDRHSSVSSVQHTNSEYGRPDISGAHSVQFNRESLSGTVDNNSSLEAGGHVIQLGLQLLQISPDDMDHALARASQPDPPFEKDTALEIIAKIQEWLSPEASRRPRPQAQGARTRTPKAKSMKKPNYYYFFNTFLKISALDKMPLHPFALNLIQQPILDFLLTNETLTPEASAPANANRNLISAYNFNAAVNLLVKMDLQGARNNLTRILLHLFFFLARVPDPQSWAEQDQVRLRMATVTAAEGKQLYTTYMAVLLQPSVTVMPLAEFLRNIKSWVDTGSKYAFIAQNLSLGSLVYLERHIRPTDMYKCTKGGENDGISCKAFAHLDKLGLVQEAERSGADGMMHRLLWELVGRVRGVSEVDGGMGKFPGFG